MQRFIITGVPGAGKTAVIRHLELEGFSVVEEAATGLLKTLVWWPFLRHKFKFILAKVNRDDLIRLAN